MAVSKHLGVACVGLILSVLGACVSAPDPAPKQESPDVYIRRQAGLPAGSEAGAIRVTDVGHLPLDTMLSIVARPQRGGWRVSYVCAASPRCAPGADSRVLDYGLEPGASARVDAILMELKRGKQPGGTAPSPAEICGSLSVIIDYKGFKRAYYRACDFGQTLAEFERLLSPPQ